MFNLVGDVIIDITQLGMMNSLLMRNIEALAKSDSFLDALMRRAAVCQFMGTKVTVKVKHFSNKVEGEQRLAFRLQQHQSRLLIYLSWISQNCNKE